MSGSQVTDLIDDVLADLLDLILVDGLVLVPE